MSVRRLLQVAAAAVLALAVCATTRAAIPVDVVKTDLRPLIRNAASSPVQFAVDVPYKVSPDSVGSWSTAGGVSTWQYAVSVPTAVSLSFHATPVHLPDGALLTVRSSATTVSYRASDVARNQIWSRIQPGDTIQFTLTVAATDRPSVVLQIISLQAGYRGLAAGVPDNPYYRQLHEHGQTGNASCVQNYACYAGQANHPLGQAAVGLVIGDEFQCTGTLINDVPNDNTPYILTARHCETGTLGGGNPSAAANVTVYWDAMTPCGQTLGTLYDPGIKTQSGATTIVEQQDAWLIQLDANPVVGDAQFAGFDATGGAIVGGYTVHHALGYDKQFTEWFGQAFAVQASDVLGSTYVSDFWEVVNLLGNVGPGASGSGLFDQNNHLVGSLTLGRTTDDPSGYGICPVSPPSAPNGTNGVADFTSFAAVWSSTADPSSSTGSTTLQSVLDPAGSTPVVSSMAAAPITFAASTASVETGQSAELTWTVPNATQCSASGGLPGDGWTGTLPASGSQSISEGVGGVVAYKITCPLSTIGSVSASVSIAWDGSVPFVQVYADRPDVWTTRPADITWTSNVSPCSVSGGDLSLTGQPSSGAVTPTQSTTGDVTYTVSCGSASTAASGSATVSYITPSLVLQANATDRIVGEQLGLLWLTWADTCTPSGGAPNDGWDTSEFGPTTMSFYPRVSTAGTYTYTLTCTSGPISVTQSVIVTFENNAPYVTASVSPTSVVYSASPADYITVNWTTNLATCNVSSTPPLGETVGPTSPIVGFSVDGPVIIAPQAPGTYTVSVSCGAPGEPTITSTPMTVTVQHPAAPTATISVSPTTSVSLPAQFTVTWSSTNASGCTASGDVEGSGGVWSGALAASGSEPVSVNQPGQYTIAVTCQSIDATQGTATAQTTFAVVGPTESLSASPTQVTVGESFSLTWTSSNATACSAGGGGADGSPWSGSLALAGSATQTATTVGTFIYAVTCSNNGIGASQSQVQITVAAATTTGGGGSSGGGGHSGGGGGAIGLIDLCWLMTLCAGRYWRLKHHTS
jgi:hypothetical protein